MRRLILAITFGLATTGIITAAPMPTQASNPRFGVWKLDSTAPPPSNNIMTYEPYEDGGMRITVESTNATGRESTWSYVTLLLAFLRKIVIRFVGLS